MVVTGRHSLDNNERTKGQVCSRSILIGRLIISLNYERDVAVQIATDRGQDISKEIKSKRDASHQQTDSLLSELKPDWPQFFQRSNNTRLKSPHLFKAILASHRVSVKPGSYFWEEVKFYSELIESFLVWLQRELHKCAKQSFAIELLFSKRGQSISENKDVGNDDADYIGYNDDDYDENFHRHPSLHETLHSFSYLMTSLAYLGAEQAMCSSFHSVVCFSHTETYHYANYTFSAEALFRLYKFSLINTKHYHSFGKLGEKNNYLKEAKDDFHDSNNINHKAFSSIHLPIHSKSHENENEKLLTNKWSSSDYKLIFPELSYCRQEILADLDSVGAPLLPSNCNQARRNDTSVSEVNIVVAREFEYLTTLLEKLLIRRVENVTYSFFISTTVLISVAIYVITVHLIRYAYIKFKKPKLKRKKKQLRSNLNTPNNTTTLSTATSAVNMAQINDELSNQPKLYKQSLQQIPLPPSQPATQQKSTKQNLLSCSNNIHSTLHVNHVFTHDQQQNIYTPTQFQTTSIQKLNQTLPLRHYSSQLQFQLLNQQKQLPQQQLQQQQPQQQHQFQQHHQKELLTLPNHSNSLQPDKLHLKTDNQHVVSLGALKVASV
ncbi:hypothetical protein HELRODRAFT_169109 [Helobdella robusta]|uniref:Uncharacterized protein n=1 Tax=Helobdella robusta TaxID=6412 RepID=T1F1E7_HELRO|nr:hypothetical protein HELRODRAFT_169109 [Helobdella robusta]ESO09164.1 hypothetical protein HELRODRAFT_169109 [Helobdella robusta]